MSERAGLPASYDADISREPDEWIWPAHIPQGEVTLMTAADHSRSGKPAAGDSHAGELTYADLPVLKPGQELHWTNWPGRESQPVTVTAVQPGGVDVVTEDGKPIPAFADELTWKPRACLGQPYPDAEAGQ